MTKPGYEALQRINRQIAVLVRKYKIPQTEPTLEDIIYNLHEVNKVFNPKSYESKENPE